MAGDVAKLFKNGRSQAVRIPKTYRFSGNRVRISRAGRGILLEPIATDIDAWFARIDQVGNGFLLEAERNQPLTPKRDVF